MSAFKTAIDHIVVGAGSLQDGREYIQQSLGVEIPFGGVHDAIGTHNHLMRLGDSTFLEVIAINPAGQPPAQPRWFGLDDPAIRASIARKPRLLTWVANVADLQAVSDTASFDCGVITGLSRGALNWSFALPADGGLHASGMLPYLMQWASATHPATGMADTGCQLQQLKIKHPYPHWLSSRLRSIGAEDLVELEAGDAGTTPVLTATIKTPSGIRSLSSCV